MIIAGFELKKVTRNSKGSQITTEILSVLKDWQPNPDDKLDDLLELSEKSLTEVKHLTEYEDDKANRILTAIAFLSAFAGVLYVGLLPQYLEDNIGTKTVGLYIPIFFHIVFAIYCLFTIFGAFLVIKAVRPRFMIPDSWSNEQNGGQSTPGQVGKLPTIPSFLFFEKILDTKPSDWARAFTKNNANNLKIQYIKNYIHESYLVADKIRTKMKSLKPGVFFLQISVVVLFIWICVCAWNFYNKPPNEASTVHTGTGTGFTSKCRTQY